MSMILRNGCIDFLFPQPFKISHFWKGTFHPAAELSSPSRLKEGWSHGCHVPAALGGLLQLSVSCRSAWRSSIKLTLLYKPPANYAFVFRGMVEFNYRLGFK